MYVPEPRFDLTTSGLRVEGYTICANGALVENNFIATNTRFPVCADDIFMAAILYPTLQCIETLMQYANFYRIHFDEHLMQLLID